MENEISNGVSTRTRILVLVIILALLGGGGWYLWDQGYLSGGVKLRGDLPLAPRGYDAINKDPQTVSELPQKMQEDYMRTYEETLKNIKEHPDSQLAWDDLAQIKHAFGDYKGAEEAWLYAVELSSSSSNSPTMYLNLADLYWNKLKNYERAEWAYRSAIEHDRSTVRAYRDLAHLYRFSYTEKKDQAIPTLREGIEQGSGDTPELLALAGMWAWQDGNIDDAIIYYEEYVKLNPDNAAAKQDLEELKKLKK